MSIRKGKTQLFLDIPTLSSLDNNRQNEDIDDDHSKERPAWSRPWKRMALVTAACFVVAAMVSLILVLPSRSLTRLSTTSSSNNIHIRKTLTESQQHCTVWIAPSSLKGVNGYGTFTTRNLQAGERILPSHDGLGVPIESYTTRSSRAMPFEKERSDWVRVWKNYWWARGVPDHVAYEGATDVVDYQIGFGALPNHHCLLEALTIQYPAIAYDDSMVDRYRDPGTGAFSYNMGREFLVTKPLKAGDEIFLNYGYCEHDSSSPDWTANIYMTEDFDAAVSLIGSYKRRKDSLISYDSSGRLKIVDETKVSKLVKELLPQTKQEFDSLVDGAVHRETLTLKIAQSSLNRRSPDWIRRNGMCMENIVPRVSTIPHAGQGAFANFNLRSGEIIAPAPLMQIVDKNALNVYSSDRRQNGTQLLMNYCFSHKESSLLLCPNTNAVLINHCSHRKMECGPNGPNARYQWSSGWDPTSDKWRQMTLATLLEQNGRGLAFEIVATRDIRQGEEIFMDYGVDWEQAWDDHVAHWRPPALGSSFLPVKVANEQQGPIFESLMSGDLRRTVENQHHMFTGCVYGATEDDDHPVYHKDADWKELGDNAIMTQYASDGSRYRYSRSSGTGDYRKHRDKVHWPCTVIRRHTRSNSTYVVRIHQSPYPYRTGEMPWYRHNVPRILYNYPRASIRYFKLPFTSDQHLPGVFRHPIGIRDELFPDQWRNLAGNAH